MSHLLARHLILPLPRPQYITVPEVLITSLAWTRWTIPAGSEGAKVSAYVYRTEDRETKTLRFIATEPTGAKAAEFGAALAAAGIVSAGNQLDLARAVASGIAGVKSRQGRTQAATPLSSSLALLQNMEGLQAAANPPNVAKILETMFQLGVSESDADLGVAVSWFAANEYRLSRDGLVAGLDRAVRQSLVPDVTSTIARPPDPLDFDAWRGHLSGTPYEWLVGNWRTVTDEQWVDALPARVWVDWASTVLRLAVGMGYLWEAAFYETVARMVLRGNSASWEEIRGEMPDILPWRSSKAGKSIRDVASLLTWRTRRSQIIRKLIESWCQLEQNAESELSRAIALMGDDAALCRDLEAALGSRTQSHDNIYEAVNFTLKTREESGQFADHYGLLAKSGRYMIVDPGAEWVAVVASLQCPEPGGETDVGKVAESLSRLGLRPELPDLVALLERAGMARGSADADQGVLVRSAF